MNKIADLYHQIMKSSKYKTAGIAIVFLIIIILFIYLNNIFKRQKSSPLTEPIITSVIETKAVKDPFPTPSISIQWSNTKVDIPSQMDTYSVENKLSSFENSTSIALSLGFTSTNQQDKSKDSILWNKNGQTLLMNFDENKIFFDSNSTPQNSTEIISEDEYFQSAKSFLSGIFGTDLTNNLENHDISYYKRQNIYDLPSTASNSNLIRVTFNQKVNNYPVFTISETGCSFTVFLDKSLKLNSFTIVNGFTKVSSSKKVVTIEISKVIPLAEQLIQRINASPDMGTGFDTASAKSLTYNQDTILVAYYISGTQIIPVYLLDGTIKIQGITDQKGIYLLPAFYPN